MYKYVAVCAPAKTLAVFVLVENFRFVMMQPVMSILRPQNYSAVKSAEPGAMTSSTAVEASSLRLEDDGADEVKKRKSEEEPDIADPKKMKACDPGDLVKPQPPPKANVKARQIRLEQNRKAARESRRRKKVMIEELQRSVIFFSRANGTLNQQNDELTRFLMQAQTQIAAKENQNETPSTTMAPPAATMGPPVATMGPPAAAMAPPASTTTATTTASEEETKPPANKESQIDLAQANVVATQAMYESKGFPAAAARAAAQALSGSTKLSPPRETADSSDAPKGAEASSALPPMQPGATMSAMTTFQQAAAVAMQAAIGQMQNVPGVSLSQLAATPAGANAYTDAMTALAMQQAAAAAGVMQPALQFLFPLLPQNQQQQEHPKSPAETRKDDV